MIMNIFAQGRRLACHGASKPLHFLPRPFVIESKPLRHSPRAYSRQFTIKCASYSASASTDTNGGYKVPPEEILKIVDSPPEPLYSFSPSRKIVLQLTRPPSYPPIAELARPELKLAGVRIDPEGFCRSRMSYYTGMSFAPFSEDLSLPFKSETGQPIRGIPEGYGINDVSWSSDSKCIAFTIRKSLYGAGANEPRPPAQLWVADIATGEAKCLLERPLNSIFEDYTWVDDNTIIASVIPDNHPPPPIQSTTPLGPRIEENLEGKKSQTRTYQDLLKNKEDIELWEHYCTSQLVIINVTTGESRLLVPEERIYTAVAPSPDGEYIVAAWLEPPWSFAVPCGRFPKRVELWDKNGKVIREIAYLPLALDIPLAFDSCRKGPRGVSWRDDKPAELAWIEAQDGGDPAVDVNPRDIVYGLDAHEAGKDPNSAPRKIAGTQMRCGGVAWGHDDLALLYESEWKTRKSKTWIIKPGNPDAPPELLFDRNYEDSYSDPGSPLTRRNKYGRYVLAEIEGPRKFLMSGSGASPEGNKPFVDILDLDTKKTERLWQSSPPYYEFVSSILSDIDDEAPILKLDGLRMLGRRESIEEPPQFYLVDFDSKGKSTWNQISEFPHPYPSLKGLTKEVLRYKRSDGTELNGTLYLPPGHDRETMGKLPCLLWAYPREYKSKEAAGQLRRSPHQFDSLGSTSPLLYLTVGYAVLDGPGFPIIGEEGEEPNDTYVEQLTSSAIAAIEELRRHRAVDVEKVAVAGHSYGAFMVGGLLAHAPDLFACGIARSGAYNRTLTPFGFQSEERTLWEAPDIYNRMSPFNNADKVKKPMLLIHGNSDNNPGTLTLQSERYYAALKGHGVVAKLVLLPFESHSYAARESILHTLAEQFDWLESYCK